MPYGSMCLLQKNASWPIGFMGRKDVPCQLYNMFFLLGPGQTSPDGCSVSHALTTLSQQGWTQMLGCSHSRKIRLHKKCGCPFLSYLPEA